MSKQSAIQFLINTSPIKLDYFKDICQSTYEDDYAILLEVVLESPLNFLPPSKRKWLLEKIDYNKPLNAKEEYAIHMAAERNVVPEIFKTIVNKTKNLEVKNENGQTPLMYAAIFNRYDNFLHLFRSGAQFQTKDRFGISLEDMIKYSTESSKQKMYHLINIKNESKQLKDEVLNPKPFRYKKI